MSSEEEEGQKEKQAKQLHDSLNEISSLRSRLDSKAAGLVLISEELLEAKRERDEYRSQSEKWQEKYNQLRQRMESNESSFMNDDDHNFSMSHTTLAQILSQLGEQNKALIYELEDVKNKLIDSEEDVQLLRKQIDCIEKRTSCSNYYEWPANGCNCDEERIQPLIDELEESKNRLDLIEKDMISLLDEKEDLILSRDAYKAKYEKLYHLLRSKDSSRSNMINIDSLLIENHLLTEKIIKLEEDKQRLSSQIVHLKTRSQANSGGNSLNDIHPIHRLLNKDSSNKLISSQSIEELLANSQLNNLDVSQNSINHLKNLVIALYESLSDKTSGLEYQKKSNHLLNERLKELENKIKELKTREKVYLLKNEFNSSTSNTGDTSDIISKKIGHLNRKVYKNYGDDDSDENNELKVREKLQNLISKDRPKAQEDGVHNK